jgi:hypothetical protein
MVPALQSVAVDQSPLDAVFHEFWVILSLTTKRCFLRFFSLRVVYNYLMIPSLFCGQLYKVPTHQAARRDGFTCGEYVSTKSACLETICSAPCQRQNSK